MLQLAFEMSSDGILLHELTTTPSHGQLIAVNDAICRLLGYTAEELRQLTPFDLMSPEDVQLVPQDVERMLRDGTLVHEKLLRAKDGTTIPVEISSRRFEEEGRVLALSLVRDVRERKHAQDEVRRSESRLRAFVDSDVIGILFGDVDGRVYDCNRELTRIIGRSRDDVLAGNVSWMDITPPEDLPLDERALAEAAVRGRCTPYEKHLLRPDGTSVPVQVGYVLLEPERRKTVAFILDITAREQAEEALRRSGERFRALIEKATDMIAVLDDEARIQFWSPSATEGLGWNIDEVLGRSAFELMHPEDHARVAEVFDDLVGREGSTARMLFRHWRKDGTWRELEAYARNLLGDPAVHGVVVNSRDVTEQRALEAQLQQSQKLESVGRLAGGIAHDFNNLLTVILSGADALKQGLQAAAPVDAEIVEEIGAAGARARDLTRQLLAFARKQVIAPVPLDLNAVVRGSEKMLRRLLGEDIEFLVNLDPALWTVRCDPGQLEQVIMNLAVNARDAMPGGGRFVIATGNVRVGPEEVVRFPVERPGEFAMLVVRDSGTGMTPEVKAHVFEPFFTTKSKGEGTGLGLATVYGIVKQSGGHIHLTSEPGEGTAFQIVFPRTLDDAVAEEPRLPTSTGARGEESILVVEDDPQVRAVTTRSLRAGGYRVIAAASGRDALRLDAEELGRVRLLVTDVVMPGLNGVSLAEALRQLHPRLRVLYVSGYTQDAIVQRGVLEPGIAFLPKPFTAASLLARVRAALDEP